MFVRVAMTAALAAVGALGGLAGCRESQERRGASGEPTAAGGPAGQGTAAPAERGGGGATPERRSGAAESAGASAELGTPRGAPVAAATLRGRLRGKLELRAVAPEVQGLTAVLALEEASPGTYALYLFGGAACAELERPLAVSPTGDEPAGAKDSAGFRSLGRFSVAVGARAPSLSLGALGEGELGPGQVVVVYPLEPGAGAAPRKGASPAACGALGRGAGGEPPAG